MAVFVIVFPPPGLQHLVDAQEPLSVMTNLFSLM